MITTDKEVNHYQLAQELGFPPLKTGVLDGATFVSSRTVSDETLTAAVAAHVVDWSIVSPEDGLPPE